METAVAKVAVEAAKVAGAAKVAEAATVGQKVATEEEEETMAEHEEEKLVEEVAGTDECSTHVASDTPHMQHHNLRCKGCGR